MRPVRIVAVVAAVALWPACGGEDGTEAVAAVDAPDIVEVLCAAADDANAGKVESARDDFRDVHGALHTLADRVDETDRQAAGELLRAKQAVEGAIERADGPRLSDLLGKLAVAVAVAGDTDAPRCA